jgi:DnaJ domain
MADEVDYYAVLGLPPSADDATIRLAYRRLARRYHPDIAGDENLHLMQTLNQAYQTLSDPERRRLYDASRPPPVDNAEPSRAAQHPPQYPPQRPQQQPHSPTQAAPRPESVTASAGPLRRLAVFDDGQASAVVSVALAQGGAVAAVGHIDGQIALWNTTRDRPMTRLALGTPGRAGTLSEVRISADATLVMAWGFALGLAVWHLADGARRWSSQMNAPSGLMDAVFLPHPAGLLRLALPDAPQALAESDPFYWADRGRSGTAIYTRPLPASGPIHPGWATPLRCYEAATGRQKRPETVPWQVRERILSADGRRLLTFSTGRPEGRPRSQVLRLWDIEARSHRGSVEPRRIAEVIEPDGRLLFPLATTPDLAIVSLADFLGHMQVRSLDGRLRRTVATGPVPIDAFAALTSDAALLALAHGQRLGLWDTRTGQQLQNWQLTAPLTALSFAPTAHPVLALGLPNGLTEMWG